MPQLVFKGLQEAEVQKLSTDLPEELSLISETPKDYFTFEYVDRKYFFKGEVQKMYPLVEVIQYKREQEVEEKMALAIQKAVKKLGHLECEVYFIHLLQRDYYE